jgi:hypothetical protein
VWHALAAHRPWEVSTASAAGPTPCRATGAVQPGERISHDMPTNPNAANNWQREGLDSGEQQRATELERLFDRIVLLRSQATALLKQRGHDIGPLVEYPHS